MVYALQANGIDRADTAGCNGAGWREGECYTLNTVDKHAVVFDAYQHHGYRKGETCNTLTVGQNNTIRGDTPLCVFDITGVTSNSMKSPTPDSCFKQRDIGRTLDTFVGSPECNQGGMVVVKSIDCRNMVLNDELSGTLQAKENGGQSLNYQNPILCLNDQGGR